MQRAKTCVKSVVVTLPAAAAQLTRPWPHQPDTVWASGGDWRGSHMSSHSAAEPLNPHLVGAPSDHRTLDALGVTTILAIVRAAFRSPMVLRLCENAECLSGVSDDVKSRVLLSLSPDCRTNACLDSSPKLRLCARRLAASPSVSKHVVVLTTFLFISSLAIGIGKIASR